MRRGMGLVVGLVVVVFVALLVGGSYVSSKNQMVARDQDVKASWSDIDTTLQRRADLIPNLVETVKGYAKHEETVFADIANARAGLLNAHSPEEKIQANGRLDSALGRLLAISEAYPDLKANQNFLSLQDQLEGTENRIQVARRRYNEKLRDYNTFIQQFPNSLWAGIAGYHPNSAYFQASEGSRTAPAVKF
jgi:LemA protein